MKETEKVTKEKAVIWDMDGVLADTADFHFHSWRTSIKKKFGIEIDRAAFDRAFGRYNEDTLKELLGRDPKPAKKKRTIKLKEELFRREIKRLKIFQPMAGVIRLLEELQAFGWIQAIASSAPQANIDLLLGKMKIRSWFKEIVSSDKVTAGKPDPEIFLKAAQAIHVPPERCVVVEDTPVGIQAARKANMLCISVTTTLLEKDLEEASPDLIFKDLTQVTINNFSNLIRKK